MLFLIFTVIVLNCLIVFAPKKLSAIELIVTTLFAMYLEAIVDIYLDLKYDLFGYFFKGVDWRSLLYLFGIYPAINLLFLNFFPFRRSFHRKFLYILGWTIFSVLYELFFLWSGTFYYRKWSIWYSAMIYPGLFIMLILFHNYILSVLEKYRHIKK